MFTMLKMMADSKLDAIVHKTVKGAGNGKQIAPVGLGSRSAVATSRRRITKQREAASTPLSLNA